MDHSAVKVMVVDDQLACREMIQLTLEDSFDVFAYELGEQCLEDLNSVKPELILLDVNLDGGMNGYETCKRIRQTACSKDTPVIFLSANTELQDKLNGYEVGGDDYVTKPVDLLELKAKISTAISTHKQQSQVLLNANDMVAVAMSNASEYGAVVNFVAQSFDAETPEALARCLLASLALFNLNCCVQLRGFGSKFELASGGVPCKPLETQLINMLNGTERIQTFGQRLTFNFEHCSLLIKNMPLDDADKCGRLRDHLALIMNAADARIRNFNISLETKEKIRNSVDCALQDINRSMSEMEKELVTRGQGTTALIDILLSEMNESFSTMALTLEQEEHFIFLVNKHTDKIIQLYHTGRAVEEKFHNIAESLNGILIDAIQES